MAKLNRMPFRCHLYEKGPRLKPPEMGFIPLLAVSIFKNMYILFGLPIFLFQSDIIRR